MAFAARMSILVEQLSKHLVDGRSIEHQELSTKLQNLSKFIDHAVARNLKPNQQQLIFNLFKQFTSFKCDEMLRPSVMMLLQSIKGACLAGWFSNLEVAQLLETCKYLSEQFLLDGKCVKQVSFLGEPLSNEISNAESFMAMICSRYYPRMTVISVLLALTVKPRHDSIRVDFHVTSQPAMSTKLRLFVCQRDDTGTSACLTTPRLLSFLVNGNGVENRVYVSPTPEPGPQFPSDITSMLRMGCNSLQFFGKNEANYFVAVAVMGSVEWPPSSLQLQGYVDSPSTTAETTDGDVTVGCTRVSLRCPISLKRISTPAKGVSCRHHQAFDYDSYIDINARRPSWRCPCCNTYVNCSELRLDRQMERILKEVDHNLLGVVINQDGSWAPDVPADEANFARDIQSQVQVLDDGLVEELEERVITISDDEEDDLVVGTLVSPRELCVCTMNATSIPPLDVLNIKPDIRTIFVSDAVASTPSQTPIPLSNIERPLNAIYSQISDIRQGEPVNNVASVSSVPTVQGRYINTTQNGVRNPSSWVPASGFRSPSGQPSERNSVTMEGELIQAEPSSPTDMIQALQAHTVYSNPRQRDSVTLKGRVDTMLNVPRLHVPGASLLPSSLPYEVQAIQQRPTHQQQHQRGEKLHMPMIRRLRQVQEEQASNHSSAGKQRNLDSTGCDQRSGRRPPKKKLRNPRTRRFTSASSHRAGQAGQAQQSPNQLRQQTQSPTISTLDNPLPDLDYSHRRRLSQHLQEGVQPSSSPGDSSFPMANGGLSGVGAPTGGLQRNSASPLSSNPTVSGRTNSISNITADSNTSFPRVEGWVPPQLTNWKQAGTRRMRGAITVGSAAGMSSGLSGSTLSGMAQAGPTDVASSRVSSNASNAISATPAQTMGRDHGIKLWTGRNPFQVGGSGEICRTPELAETTMLEDISGTSTVLDGNQMDNVGHTGPGSCPDG
ncbi:unnamed protein product [Calypogeia fissa]